MKRSAWLIILLVICFVLSSVNPAFAFYDSGTPVGTLEELQSLTCPRCGEHVSVAVSQAATCTSFGRGFLYCDHCSYGYYGAGTYRYFTSILPSGHSYYTVPIRSASCISGEQVQYTCSKCGDSYIAEGNPLGHNYVATVLKEVTCTEDGNERYTCSRCSDSYEQTVEALGHDFIYDEKEPTCTEDGYKNGKCSRCGETTETVYPALGHTTEGEWTEEKKAGYLRKGTESQVCSVCKETVYRDIPRKDPTVPILCISGGAVIIAAVTIILKKRKTGKKSQSL